MKERESERARERKANRVDRVREQQQELGSQTVRGREREREQESERARDRESKRASERQSERARARVRE